VDLILEYGPGADLVSSVRTKLSHRGRGDARAVLELVCAEADAEGRVLLLAVEPDPGTSETRLRGFYRSVGFRALDHSEAERFGIPEEWGMIRIPGFGEVL